MEFFKEGGAGSSATVLRIRSWMWRGVASCATARVPQRAHVADLAERRPRARRQAAGSWAPRARRHSAAARGAAIEWTTRSRAQRPSEARALLVRTRDACARCATRRSSTIAGSRRCACSAAAGRSRRGRRGPRRQLRRLPCGCGSTAGHGAAAARNGSDAHRVPGQRAPLPRGNAAGARARSRARRTRQQFPARAATDAAQAEIDAQLDHATGDRRLDGDDPVATAAGNRHAPKLVLARATSACGGSATAR